MKHRKARKEQLKRSNRAQIMLNDRELNAINTYCSRFRVSNRSKFMREAIITAVLQKFDEHLPSLFEEEQPTLFSNIRK